MRGKVIPHHRRMFFKQGWVQNDLIIHRIYIDEFNRAVTVKNHWLAGVMPAQKPLR